MSEYIKDPVQEEINEGLFKYCKDLEDKNKETNQRLDDLIDVVAGMAEKIGEK